MYKYISIFNIKMDIEKDFVFVPIETGMFHYNLNIPKYDNFKETWTKEYYSGIARKYSFESTSDIIRLKIDEMYVGFTCNSKDALLIKNHIFNQLTTKKAVIDEENKP